MSLIMVTNDDGVYAPGLKALYEAMKEVGRPVVIAPERDNSAVSHSLTMNRPLRVKKIEPDIFAIDGTPSDCVIIGTGKVLQETPALVVSGINRGGNIGDDVGYSGTVSAAIEGTMLGIPSIAVSLVDEEPYKYDVAAKVAQKLAVMVLERGLPKDTLLNVNVPGKNGGLAGVKFTRQGKRVYDNAIKETHDPWQRKHYWIGGGTPSWDNGKDTDAQAILSHHVSITPIHLDLTNYDALEHLGREWDVGFIDE